MCMLLLFAKPEAAQQFSSSKYLFPLQHSCRQNSTFLRLETLKQMHPTQNTCEDPKHSTSCHSIPWNIAAPSLFSMHVILVGEFCGYACLTE